MIKIVKILGGLGNQMFQYALFLRLMHDNPSARLMLDVHSFRGYPHHHGYQLAHAFGIEAPMASLAEVSRLAYPYAHYRLWQVMSRVMPHRATMCSEPADGRFIPEAIDISHDTYYDGYWLDERYFSSIAHEVRKAFIPTVIDQRNADFIHTLDADMSISLHVRRGDYVNHPLYTGICDLDYYRRAIAEIDRQLISRHVDTERLHFCIFSNDPEWCRAHILPLLKGRHHTFVDWNSGTTSHLDITLMSHCRHHIIANSSFSWWGAWLNPDSSKIVICPTRWNNAPASQINFPAYWTRS